MSLEGAGVEGVRSRAGDRYSKKGSSQAVNECSIVRLKQDATKVGGVMDVKGKKPFNFELYQSYGTLPDLDYPA